MGLLGRKKMEVIRHGLALEADGHFHAIIYDAASGNGETTLDEGHSHLMKDYELCKHDMDLHEHVVKFASTLTKDEQAQVSAMIIIDEEDKGERTKEEHIRSCVAQLKKEGNEESKAYAICTAAQNKKGKKDASMGAALGNAMDQAKCSNKECGYTAKSMPNDKKCPKCGATMKMINK